VTPAYSDTRLRITLIPDRKRSAALLYSVTTKKRQVQPSLSDPEATEERMAQKDAKGHFGVLLNLTQAPPAMRAMCVRLSLSSPAGSLIGCVEKLLP
jgi:hypothetical protein